MTFLASVRTERARNVVSLIRALADVDRALPEHCRQRSKRS